MIEKNNIPDFLVRICCMTFNHAPFIEDTMNGFCMQQTDFPFIAIICDDASTDGEQEVIRKYLKENFLQNDIYHSWEDEEALFFYSRHKVNVNCYFFVVLLKNNYYSQGKDKEHLWNHFIKESKYIATCEGDDYWININKLQLQADILDKYVECSFCVTDYKEYSEYTKCFKNHQLNVNKNIQGGLIFLSINDYISRGFFTKTLTALYRKDALDQSKYSNYEAHYDMPFFFALMTQGVCVFINEEMGVYRLSDAGVTSPIHRSAFIDYQLPRLFSIIKVEKTWEAQQFVYIFMERYIIYVIATRQYAILLKCFTHFSLILLLKLFLYELPRQVWEILSLKIKVNRI